MAWVQDTKQFCNCTGSRRAETAPKVSWDGWRGAVPKRFETRSACSCRTVRYGPRNRLRRWRSPGCPPACGVGCVLLGDRPTQRNDPEQLPWVLVPCPPTSTTFARSWGISTFLKFVLRRDYPAPGLRTRLAGNRAARQSSASGLWRVFYYEAGVSLRNDGSRVRFRLPNAQYSEVSQCRTSRNT